jgi:hypothetical protein
MTYLVRNFRKEKKAAIQKSGFLRPMFIISENDWNIFVLKLFLMYYLFNNTVTSSHYIGSTVVNDILERMRKEVVVA